MKTLLTWIGYNEDFTIDGKSLQVSPQGFTGSIHRDIIEPYGFEKHIILMSIDRSGSIEKELVRRKKILSQFLKDTYPSHLYEILDTGIDKSDLQNYPVIESNLRSLLLRFDATVDLHVIAGTGPTAVGMAWCTLYLAMSNRFQLHVMQRPEYAPGEKYSTLKRIEPYISEVLDNKLREYHFNIDLPDTIYKDEIVLKEYEMATAIAPAADVNVLILGETGCGKDRMAEFIVNHSPRGTKNYRAINCASLPDTLLYTELFGSKKGAYTDAVDRKGLFEECNGGTLFMDEIGDISPMMQQSLLRALENKEIKRAGSTDVIKNVDVRIIAATNNNLYEKCKAGAFRWDLYYRLCTMEIELQPYRSRTLKERKEIIEHYIKLAEKKWNRKIKLTMQAADMIEKYSFPGNFREIYNCMNGIFALGIDTITEALLPKRFADQSANLDETYEAALRKHCISIYKKYKYDLTATCKALGYKNSTQVKSKLIAWGEYKNEY